MSAPETTATRPSADYVLWLVDFDGTVRHGKDELGRFVNGPDDVVIFPEVPALLHEHIKNGDKVVVGITNQAGVALGHMSEDECWAAVVETRRQAKTHDVDPFHAVACCIHHPDDGCWCRKPNPGALIYAALQVRIDGGPAASRTGCLFVGDRPEDAEAAARAGIDFRLASEWRAGQ